MSASYRDRFDKGDVDTVIALYSFVAHAPVLNVMKIIPIFCMRYLSTLASMHLSLYIRSTKYRMPVRNISLQINRALLALLALQMSASTK